jgi:hypothetical protein
MSTAEELNRFLAAWRIRVHTQLKEYRDCMTLTGHAERLDRLLAASSELERYRMELEQQLHDEISSGNHTGEVQRRIQVIHGQSNKINQDSRNLVMLVGMIIEQRKDSPAKQQSVANLKDESMSLVEPVNDVENKIQELLDSSEELSKRLGRNGAPVTAVGHQAEAPSNLKPDQREEPA